MKKSVVIFLIIFMLFSLMSCKRADDNEQAAVRNDVAEDNVKKENVPVEIEEAIVTKEQDEQESTDTKTEEVTQSGSQETSEESPSAEAEETAEVTYEKKNFGDLEYPSDLFFNEFLPYKLGYAQKTENEDGTFTYRASEDFTVREDITKEMVEALKQYPDPNFKLYNDTPSLSNTVFFDVDEPTFEMYDEGHDTVIRGHFEQDYGTRLVAYTVNPNRSEGINFAGRAYTVYNFVVDKIYDEDCGYSVGDVIEIASETASVKQDLNGYYWSDRYSNFSEASIEERSYVVSLIHSEETGVDHIYTICQNVYADVKEGSVEYDILQKYN